MEGTSTMQHSECFLLKPDLCSSTKMNSKFLSNKGRKFEVDLWIVLFFSQLIISEIVSKVNCFMFHRRIKIKIIRIKRNSRLLIIQREDTDHQIVSLLNEYLSHSRYSIRISTYTRVAYILFSKLCIKILFVFQMKRKRQMFTKGRELVTGMTTRLSPS